MSSSEKNFYGDVYRPVTSIPAVNLFNLIWENKERYLSLTLEKSVNELSAHRVALDLLEEYPYLVYGLKDELRSMITDLKDFPGEKIQHSCKIHENQIGYVDKSGNLSLSSRCGYKTAFAYLYYSRQRKISTEHVDRHLDICINGAAFLYSEIPNFFEVKLGLTATLECLSAQESSILDNYMFNRKSLIPTTFNKQPLVELPTTVVRGTRVDFYKEILKEIQVVIKAGRACFVIMKDTKSVKQFNKFIAGEQRDVLHFSLNNPHRYGFGSR